MVEYFRKFARHSAIYALGNGINRGAAFLLIPLYTRVLDTGDYGSLEMFYVVAGVLRTLLGMGIAHATLRFYFDYETEGDRKKVLSTSLLVTLAVSCIAAFLLHFHNTALSLHLFKTGRYASSFDIVYAIVVLELTREIFMAYLRVKERSLTYIAVSTAQLVLQLSLNIYLVKVLHLGVEGVLIGNALSIAATWAILAVVVFRYCGFNIDGAKLISMAKYCGPIVLGSLGGMVIQNADRYMLNAYTTLEAVGLYALASKFAIGVRELIIEPFSMHFGQARFAIVKEKDARLLYSRTLTYFTLGLAFFSLAVALFSKPLVMLLAGERFWPAWKIVPLVLLPVLLQGIGYILQTGILIEKKTKHIFYLTMLQAALIVGLNIILIPRFHTFGTALTLIVNGIVVCLATYWIANRIYEIPYEKSRLANIFLISAGLAMAGFLFQYFAPGGAVPEAAFKLLLLAVFPLLLHYSGFFHAEELDQIRGLRIRLLKGKIGGRTVP